MKIEIMGNYPEEVKDYCQEYNTGIDQKDINIVGTAINSLVQLLFSTDELNRQASMHALDQVGKVQPGFLKSAAKTLIIRFKGTDEMKQAFSGAALEAIFIGKKAEKLITDPQVLNELKSIKQKKEQQNEANQIREAQIVKEISTTQIDLSIINAFPDLRATGQFYNTCLLNNQEEEAINTLNSLLSDLIEWYQNDKSKFTPACMLLGTILSSRFRRPFVQGIIDKLLKLYYQGNATEKNISAEIIDIIINDILDLLSPDIAGVLQAEVSKRQEERKASKNKELERAMLIGKLKVPINVAWNPEIKEIAQMYNDAVLKENEKSFKTTLSNLEKHLNSSDDRERKHATDLLGVLLGKNPNFVQKIINNLLLNFDQPIPSEILGTIIEDLTKLQWADPMTLGQIQTAKQAREAEIEKQRIERQAEYDRQKQLKIQIDGDWNKEVTKIVEQLNTSILTQNSKPIPKLINNELKKLIYAKDVEIRKEGQLVFARIAQKYPNMVDELMQELAALYLSDHEQRNIAVDTFGKIFDMGFAPQFFGTKYPEVFTNLNTEWANRKQEIENLELQTKFDAIKADVTQIRIRDTWPKNIQKITRQYNTGIKSKNTDEVLDAVKSIVNMVMNEKKEEIQEQANQVLGLIAKRNIELIQPTITLFLQLIDGSDKDKKNRAIKGLGEVTRQRPGWAYFGIEKLIQIAQTDKDDDFRMKAMLEIGRIGEKDSVMLIEYINPIIISLSKDPNKHVRRLAAWTLGNMAEAIPLEAKEAIPALTDALHDEYILVRKFADKALSLIREAMRKI